MGTHSQLCRPEWLPWQLTGTNKGWLWPWGPASGQETNSKQNSPKEQLKTGRSRKCFGEK